MHILHGITRLGGAGAERQMMNLVCGSASDTIRHSAFSFQSGAYEARLIESGCKVTVRPMGGKRLPLALLTLLRLARSEKPDILQSWDPQFDVLLGLVAKITGTPFIGSERNSAEQYALPDGYGKAWFRHLRGPVLSRSASILVANSQSGLNYVTSITKSRVRGVVVRNGLDLDSFREQARIRPEFPAGVTEYIVMANRLNGPKRTEVALDLFQQVAQDFPGISLLILGEGPEEEQLKSKAAALDCAERIHFLGHVSNFGSYAAHATLFLSASRVEGMPNSVLECMSLGTPCLVSDIEPHRDIYKDSDGGVVLFPADDLKASAAILRRLLASPEYRGEIAAKGSNFALQCTISAMCSSFIEIYKDLAA